MARGSKTKAFSVAALGVGAIFLLASAAFGAPPQGRPQSRLQIQGPAQHLDLRPPAHAVEAGNAAEKLPSAFTAHRQTTAKEPVEAPILGADGMRTRPPIQDFVQKVRREGLPVARLFETKSALLHLGLNPRGKPGLWLVQKTR